MALLKSELIKTKNTINPENTQGYSLTYLPETNALLLYGTLSNSDVYLFSLTKKQWTMVKTFGKKPSFRRFYAHYYHRKINGLIVHGGEIIEKHKKARSSDQCYVLFVESWQWRKIFLQQNPKERQFHQFFTNHQLNDEIFTYGGFSKPYDYYLNDLWVFKNIQHLSTKTNKHEVHGCESKQIQTRGQAPPIYGYTAKAVDHKVIFFGGGSQIQKKKLEINVLCLKTFTWQKVQLINKACPSLICLSVYESGIDSQKFHIMGGIVFPSNKQNQKYYSLNLRQMQISQQAKSDILQSIYHTCCITQTPLCIGSLQFNPKNDEMEVFVLYEKQPSSAISKHFETDEVEDSKEEVSIEEYLKAIKHQQILSQQLIKKNIVLQQLYKQIQRYISGLYAKYLSDEQSEQNEEIEIEKTKNIKACEELKQSYMENAFQFEETLKIIKKLRGELGEIHEDFQRCIETEIDEQEN